MSNQTRQPFLLCGNNADVIRAILRKQLSLGSLVKTAAELMRGIKGSAD